MDIRVLSENSSIRSDLFSEHGFSMYVQTEGFRLLFDFGAGELFYNNARKMGIELQKTDIAVLSHGHYDHGGGLKIFLEINDHAPVYVNRKAFEPFFSCKKNREYRYIGIKRELMDDPRVVLCGERTIINNDAILFSGITGREYFSEMNRALFVQTQDGYSEDPFEHEQNLMLRSESGRLVLAAGCAHNGIVNIMEEFRIIFGRFPDEVISGFHLTSPGTGETLSALEVKQLAHQLQQYPSHFYTCHCTGKKPYQQMKTVMGDQIDYAAAGTEIHVE